MGKLIKINDYLNNKYVEEEIRSKVENEQIREDILDTVLNRLLFSELNDMLKKK